ncbi:Lrp/AsnC family transcriptional regulator [Thalassococcus sp. CAU 1522]|uniref:siroheme decarboxylase n=1 Tax=Thalassococcus arenae TaxID=2851652 RepID=A0ABS6NC95_9RHOB|nr:Lrp/AsnC family transcriptional regulator [Thalassococcus arenae]MBV2361646.1 Lrp/AsnC family transcriptional regulator [Thalassococcus arenae]
MTLDRTDRILINRLQDGLPIVAEPFAALAAELGISQDDVLARIAAMRESGVLTRFGPFYDAAAMGGAFCLCAMAVPDAEFEHVMTLVNARPEVAHNYRRTHRLNMWFVLATEREEEIGQVAASLTEETGHKVLCFPKEAEFFVRFRVAA